MTKGLYDLITRDWRRARRDAPDGITLTASADYRRGYIDALYNMRDIGDARGGAVMLDMLRRWLSES